MWVRRTDPMDRRGAFAVDPLSVEGEERPGAVEGDTSRRTDGRSCYGDGIQRFDRMQTNVSETRAASDDRHTESLAELGEGSSSA